MTRVIVKAATIITIDPANPRAEAVVVDTDSGKVTAVGSLAQCQQLAPGVDVTDLGDTVLLPGFIDPHSHPVLSGLVTQPPVHWIAPFVGFPTFADVEAEFTRVERTTEAGRPVIFCGLDRMLQGAPVLDREELDRYFPQRPAVVMDDSGHEVYFNSGVIKVLGWADGTPPADPPASRYGRTSDGSSDGRAFETGAVASVLMPVARMVVENPAHSVAQWYSALAGYGLTASSDHAYASGLLPIYEELAATEGCPVRVSLYEVATSPTCTDALSSKVPASMVEKRGIKLWADGSPWVGTMAASFPYLDSPVTRTAQISPTATYDAGLNYSRQQFDEVLDTHGGKGLQVSTHVNGDVGIDLVLDAYERALSKNGLIGSDHRWRIEHLGGARADQLERAAALGVSTSLGLFQFIFWGDLTDGQIFPPEIGSQWIRVGDAVRAGAVVSFHNDAPVTPPNVLLNLQTAVTRRTPSGAQHGPEQIVSLDDALKAHTINAAHTLGREHEIGSIEVGKFADFVELSRDPYTVAPENIATDVTVTGTWLAGSRVDRDAFVARVAGVDPEPHHAAAAEALKSRHAC